MKKDRYIDKDRKINDKNKEQEKDKDCERIYAQDEPVINQIKESLHLLDESVSVKTPGIDQFRKLVIQVEENKKVRRRNEIFLFTLSALVILGIEVYAFSRSFASFAVLQAAGLIGFSACIAMQYRKQKRKADELW